MARALAERAQAGQIDVAGLALNDVTGVRDLGIPVHAAAHSRARFVADVHLAALRCGHFMYDYPGMGRAHPRYWPPALRPYLCWIHGIEVWEQGRADHLRVARGAAVLVANSGHTLARAAGLHSGIAHAYVCWLGTETDAVPEPWTDPESERARPPTVLILARINADGGYKGHRELIDAWPQVVAAVPDARLLIAGSGAGAGLIAGLAEASSARANIELRGFVPESEIEALWRQADVLAMPSRGEGFGLAYIEAMRQGLPVVASVHDAAPEINLDSITGYNVDLNVPSQLTDRLVQLLRDRDHAKKLGAAGRERWRTHFTYSAFRERFSPILDRLLSL
jgi:phosphatidylinositol alpha-1,6-mannosyltransferase